MEVKIPIPAAAMEPGPKEKERQMATSFKKSVGLSSSIQWKVIAFACKILRHSNARLIKAEEQAGRSTHTLGKELLKKAYMRNITRLSIRTKNPSI